MYNRMKKACNLLHSLIQQTCSATRSDFQGCRMVRESSIRRMRRRESSALKLFLLILLIHQSIPLLFSIQYTTLPSRLYDREAMVNCSTVLFPSVYVLPSQQPASYDNIPRLVS